VIKAVFSLKKNRKLLLIGLSDETMRRLREDMPIHFKGEQLGLDDLDVAIVAGRDEASITKQLHEHGLIP
jgi:hypothetical protein